MGNQDHGDEDDDRDDRAPGQVAGGHGAAHTGQSSCECQPGL
jgi:hypothetical protein